MNYPTRLRVATGIVCFLMCAGVLRAEDAAYRKLVTSWKTEREELVLKITHGWLRGASADAQKDNLLRLIQLDTRLATQPDIELYAAKFTEPSDPERCIRDLVLYYFKSRRIELKTCNLFKGRSFRVTRKDKRPTFTFERWQSSGRLTGSNK